MDSNLSMLFQAAPRIGFFARLSESESMQPEKTVLKSHTGMKKDIAVRSKMSWIGPKVNP